MFCRPFQMATRLIFLAATFFSFLVSAAAPDSSNLRIRRWTTDDGLPQHRIACLKQTRDGYLWLGTWYGLVRFNGVSFKVFNSYNTPEFKESTINALAEDARGKLWVGTGNGLLSYRDHQFHHYGINDGLPSPKVWRLATGPSGALWIQAGESLMRFDQGKFDGPWNPKSPAWYINFIEEGPNGWLNIFQNRAWVSLSPGGDQIRTNSVLDFSIPQWLIGIPARGTTGMWAASEQGLQFVEGNTVKTFALPNDANWRATLLYQDGSTNVWVGTYPSGLLLW